MRRAARIDANHADIVKALRAEGACVYDTSGLGKGFPDLVVCINGATICMEIKDGTKPPSKRKLTPGQVKLHEGWIGGPLAIVCDVQGALTAVRTAK